MYSPKFVHIYRKHLPPEQVFKHFCSRTKYYCINDEGVKLFSGVRQQNDTFLSTTIEIGLSVENATCRRRRRRRRPPPFK